MDNNQQIEFDEPHEKQYEILEAFEKYQFIVLKCGRRFGKSFICKQLSIAHILKGKQVGYVTHKYELSMDFYDQLIDLIPKNLIK